MKVRATITLDYQEIGLQGPVPPLIVVWDQPDKELWELPVVRSFGGGTILLQAEDD